jgi:hypothetical protein
LVRKLRTDEKGITPLLGAMFVVGIVITLFSIFLATWAPSETNRREREHQQEVRESFRELRAVIEDLRVGESRTVSLSMGPTPVPFVPSPRTGGTLSVTPTSTPFPKSEAWGNYWENYWEYDPGNIKFYFGDQSWIYEMGMIVLIQDDVELMDSAPHMVTVWEASQDELGVYVDVIKVRGLEGSIGGTGTSTITVSILRRFEKNEARENAVIRINPSSWGDQSSENAWWEYLESENERLGAKGHNVSLGEEDNLLTLTIERKDHTPGENDIIYYQKVTEVWVSIS